MYPTFPKMGDKWIADEITALEPLWKNFFLKDMRSSVRSPVPCLCDCNSCWNLFYCTRKCPDTVTKKLVNTLRNNYFTPIYFGSTHHYLRSSHCHCSASSNGSIFFFLQQPIPYSPVKIARAQICHICGKQKERCMTE